ncbi:SpoIID/LytB domain-containing protein [bacterium]|nr:SpoIID/LytB domain-containing protein [bacterium]
MKLLPNLRFLMFFLVVSIGGYLFATVPFVHAETQQEIEQKKSQKKQELNKILSEITIIASSNASVSSKLENLKKEKSKLEKLLNLMAADVKILEDETVKQEGELVTIANTYSLQQALYLIDSQKNFLVTLFESPSLGNVLERVLYYNVQSQSMKQQQELIETKQQGIAVKKALIAQEQGTIQKSLSEVNQQIASLEDQQSKYAVSLSKSYSQRNALVSDISKLTKAAQAIINQKANSVSNPSSGSGSGSGGGNVGGVTPPSTTGAVSLLVGGTLVKKTNSVLRMSASANEITLKRPKTAYDKEVATEYNGTLEFNKSSGVYAINELSMDEYLYGLAEMPSSWAMEALKVQAIAGRSYATYKMRYGGYGKFDLYDYVQDQEYSGTSKIKGGSGSQWKTAVDSTTKKVLEYGGKTVLALYSSDTGGHTLSSQESPSFGGTLGYLVAKPDRYFDGGVWKAYGNNVSGSRSYWIKQDRTNTMALLVDYLNAAIYYDKYKIVRTPSEQSSSAVKLALGASAVNEKVGTIQTVKQFYNQGGETLVENSKFTSYLEVIGTTGTMTVSGTGFKTAYNVRSPGTNSVWSTLYDIKKVNSEKWEVWSRGWGHRVGMSQYGAQGRALAGQNHEQILEYYYNNANVVQYDIGRKVRVALTKVGSRVMQVTAKSEISIYEGSTLIKKVPADTEIRVEYN